MKRRILSAAAGVLVATLGHLLIAQAVPQLLPVIDLFLVVTLTSAIRGGQVEGMLVGVVAGTVADAISGGPMGLHGFALTATGYLAGLAADRVAEMTEFAAGILAAAGALADRLLLLVLLYLFVTGNPTLEWWWLPATIAGSLILVWLSRLVTRFATRFGGWQRSRQQGRLRL